MTNVRRLYTRDRVRDKVIVRVKEKDKEREKEKVKVREICCYSKK